MKTEENREYFSECICPNECQHIVNAKCRQEAKEQQPVSNPTEEQVAEFIKSAFQILVGGDKYKMMDYILDSKFRIDFKN